MYRSANQIICQKRRRKIKKFIDFLSQKKKCGLEQYLVKILLLIIILEYVVTIGILLVWHPNCKLFSSNCGKERPIEPPFVFDGIPASCLSSTPPKPRKIVFASCSSRIVIPDNLKIFVKQIICYMPSKHSS